MIIKYGEQGNVGDADFPRYGCFAGELEGVGGRCCPWSCRLRLLVTTMALIWAPWGLADPSAHKLAGLFRRKPKCPALKACLAVVVKLTQNSFKRKPGNILQGAQRKGSNC